MKNLTALMCLFAKVYHQKYNIKVYNDKYSKLLLSDDEYQNISNNLESGISFFDSNYNGINKLDYIINKYISPSILARSAFNGKVLNNEIKLGAKQYLIMGSGYDTSGYYVNSKVKVFELDKADIIDDKINRVNIAKIDNKNVNYIKTDFNTKWINDLLNSSYDRNTKTVCSMLGISYYLDYVTFKNTIVELSNNIGSGSVIVFDYPYRENNTTKNLAKGANEMMKSIYTYSDILDIANDAGMLIYEHIDSDYVNKNIFYNYNTLNPDNKILAKGDVNYCLLVKNK